MNSRTNCQARVLGDQYHCDRCGVVWDINDQDPPDCRTVFNVKKRDLEINKMREILKK